MNVFFENNLKDKWLIDVIRRLGCVLVQKEILTSLGNPSENFAEQSDSLSALAPQKLDT